MEVKILELRDHMTFIPLLCVNMQPDDEGAGYLMRRVGYPCDALPNVAITKLAADGHACTNDPYHWGDRTYAVGHDYIINHWDELKNGDVVDVQFIKGETAEPKRSERFG